jgi:hypothetical protein
MDGNEGKPDSGTTTAFRLQRKAIKELFSNRPDGINKDELMKLAQAKGMAGGEFEKVIGSLLAGGHVYFEEASGRYHFVRNE